MMNGWDIFLCIFEPDVNVNLSDTPATHGM